MILGIGFLEIGEIVGKFEIWNYVWVSMVSN